MEILALGGGQEVGRSCIVVQVEGRTIMFDCGMHMGYNDARKFPDFSVLSRTDNLDKILDCVIISHFHLDHCGALPYLTEILGYSGPIYMTYPTQAVLPILLEDCQRILQMKQKDNKIYTLLDIQKCMEKIIPLNMNESREIFKGFVITPYYAGHVIGAAMFHLRAGDKSVVYTGDFSTQADKHLGSACIDRLNPDLLITESTYGNIVRDCVKIKERRFLQLIHACLKRNGKVLIPIFAFGRAQELCLLIEAYWERMALQIPIYFSGEMTAKANEIYKRFINYTNSNLNEHIFTKNAFEFKHIKPYERGVEFGDPCVIFSSPGMLHSGASLRIFKNLCEDSKNLVILPGYCVRGTVGDKVMNGIKVIDIFGEKKNINIQVENLSFSAHTDTMGIIKIINQCRPKQIMFVHGEKQRMETLRKFVRNKFKGIPVHMPPNGVVLLVNTSGTVKLKIGVDMLRKHINMHESRQNVNLVLKLSREGDEFNVLESKEFLEENREDK